MALREEVILSISEAQQQINLLESQLNQLTTTVDVPVEIEGQQALRLFEQQVAAVDAQINVDADTTGANAAIAELRQQLASAEGSAEAFGAATEGLDENFRRISSALGLSEADTRELARQMGIAQVEASSLDTDIRQVAAAMGLSEAEASRFVRQLQRAENEAGDVEQRTNRISGSFRQLRNLAGGVLAGFGVREVIQQLNATVTAASDLEQSIGGVRAIFGAAADDVLAFGEAADQAVGLSADAFNQLTAQLGAQLQSFGFAVADAGDESIRLVELGADLAATFGGPVSDAVAAIGSLLRGEINPIERYGVAVNQAAITANALEEGLIATSGEMDIQTRALSALDLLFEQTTGAQGQFAREAETTAGQLERQRAEFANIRAEIGEALIPTFNELLEVGPQVGDALTDLIPIVELLAGQFQSVADDILPVIGLLGTLADVAGAAGSAIGGIDVGSGLSDIFELAQSPINPAAPISVLVDEVQNLQSLFTEGIGTDELAAELADLEARAEAGAEPIEILGSAFGDLRAEGVDAVSLLAQLGEATGIADDELAEFTVGLIRSAERMGLTEDEVRNLRDLLASLFETGTRGEGLDFERQGRGARELADDLGLIAEASPLSAEGIEALDAAFEGVDFQALVDDFPVIIRDLEDLRIAADEAGVSTTDFVNNLPDNVTLDLSAPEQAIQDLIGELSTLDERISEFQPENVIDLSDFIDEDTGQIDADLSEIRQTINEQLGAEAEFQLDLSEIAVVAPDIAAVLEAEGIDVAGDIAAKFADDLANAADQQEFIDGNKGLAAATAEQYAEFLQDLTPEELQRVAAFGPDNLIPALRDQLVSTAQEMAEILDSTLGETTIAPDLTIDLANIIFQNLPELTFDVSATGSTATGTGTPGTGNNPPPPPPVEVVINNPTTEDLSTSATQAAQTIGAVSSSLPRVQ